MSKAAIEAAVRGRCEYSLAVSPYCKECREAGACQETFSDPVAMAEMRNAILFFLRALQAAGPSEKEVEAVAKGIYFEMNCIMHDHAENWREANQAIFRDCARAAIAAGRAQLIAEIEGK